MKCCSLSQPPYPSAPRCLVSALSLLLLHRNYDLAGTGSSLLIPCLIFARLGAMRCKTKRSSVFTRTNKLIGPFCCFVVHLFNEAVVSFSTFLLPLVEVNLWPTVSRPVCLGVRLPSGTRDQFFFLLGISLTQLHVCYFVAPSLTRGRVCNLLVQLLLGFARAVTLGSKSRRSHDHILLPHLRLPQPGGPGPVFISPRNRVAQLYPRALGSPLFLFLPHICSIWNKYIVICFIITRQRQWNKQL
jgi:hypothetical protein